MGYVNIDLNTLTLLVLWSCKLSVSVSVGVCVYVHVREYGWFSCILASTLFECTLFVILLFRVYHLCLFQRVCGVL